MSKPESLPASMNHINDLFSIGMIMISDFHSSASSSIVRARSVMWWAIKGLSVVREKKLEKEIHFIPSHIPHPTSGDLILKKNLSFSSLGVSSILKLNGLISGPVEVYQKKWSVAAVALISLLVA